MIEITTSQSTKFGRRASFHFLLLYLAILSSPLELLYFIVNNFYSSSLVFYKGNNSILERGQTNLEGWDPSLGPLINYCGR